MIVDLDELIARRRSLELALAAHEAALEAFFPAAARASFEIQRGESDFADDGTGKPPHLTSSASCYESLADRHPALGGRLANKWKDRATSFADRALCTPADGWISDEAAHVYCRVRALPMILRYASSLDRDDPRRSAASERLEEAFRIIEDRPLAEKGLGERALDAKGSPEPNSVPYPANTFHAYWGLKARARYVRRVKEQGDLPPLAKGINQLAEQNAAWAQAAIGEHTALLCAGKRRGDAQQLAFAVLADLMWHEHQVTPASRQYDLYEAALNAFFGAQEADGRWPLSQPLFHYPNSGNAYCYPFETLAELLRPALAREHGRTFRKLLEPHVGSLLAAWDYAMATRIPIHGDVYGWSSTHHISRQDPEAWATAEVFSFGQLLRCVVGHIVAERAAAELRVRRPDYVDQDEARDALAVRGATWAPDGWTVGRELAALFLHPAAVPTDGVDGEIRDPDAALIGADYARSAVLFGPPGTGKTSIVEALAGALGWEFVEVLASDFLAEGVDAVPARADRIFDRIMQLDRCVVLFDEIDELIRERSDDQSDPFGRFLTTSMLPKIAKLWKQRRIIFFVATNHVSKADSAITRSSRFDARIFVAPPGLTVKQRLLDSHPGAGGIVIDRETVARALASPGEVGDRLKALAALPLLRYDQMPELARKISARNGDDGERLAGALAEMVPALLRHEWQGVVREKNNKHEGADTLIDIERLVEVYGEYVKGISHDESRHRLADLGELAASGGREQIRGTTLIRIEGPLQHLDQGDAVEVDGIRDDGLLTFRTPDATAAHAAHQHDPALVAGTQVPPGLPPAQGTQSPTDDPSNA